MRILLILVVLAGFVIVHLIKMMRMYLIVMDKKYDFEKFVPAYLRTTLVNLIIPFKLGEIYRIVVFGRMTDNFETGFFSVLIDRFFDTFAIVLLLLPYQILVTGNMTMPVIVLSLFLIVLVFAYIIFPSSYRFLNRYIITSKSSKRSMSALKMLEMLREWYEYVSGLVSGRYGLMILFSVAAWMFEITVLIGFSRIFGVRFKISDFGTYIESILSGRTYALSREYTIASICVIAVATLISVIVYFAGRTRRKSL